MQYIYKIAGILIFLSFLLTLYSYFIDEKFLIISGIFAWSSFLILFNSIKNKTMISILFILSLMAFLISYFNGFKIDYIKVFTVNQYLLTLLIAVGFLRLIAKPKKDKLSILPKGKESFIKTYLGVHLFGSVINLSSLILVADKMYKKAPLTNSQIILLTRAFSSDAYWSPFFVAFAAAITYAPKLNTTLILLNGIILAFFAFFITYFEVTRNKEFKIDEFRGYPLTFNSLYLPFILGLLVLVTNYFYQNIKVIVLISLYSLLMTIFILALKKGFKQSLKRLNQHIIDDLPKMRVEMGLFLVSGMFGILAGSILIGMDIRLPFEIFDWKVASLLLLIFIFLAFIGIHPIITIAIIGDFFNEVNHTLLALTFLMAWSTTVSTSPFSGLNLTIVARYGFEGKEIFKLNIFYALKMYLVCVLCLFILSKYLNI